MSATLRKIDRDTIGDLLGVDEPTLIHGPLDCRGTNFQLIMSGNPLPIMQSSLFDHLEYDDENNTYSQAVLYSKSKTNVEGSLLDMSSTILDKLHRNRNEETFADSLTGGDGIKQKTCTMSATVTNYMKVYEMSILKLF